MLIIQYLILGIIQGITEPLPISSSGHLRIFQELFNANMFNDLNFEIFVHFGSLVAIFIIFKKDIIKLIRGFFGFIFTKADSKENAKKKESFRLDYKYCWLIVIGTIPAGITGFLFKEFLEERLADIRIVGIALFITALMLFVVKNIKGRKDDKDITYKDAILIGLMQAIALVPGISRSGTVLVGCLLRDFKREVALKYTFMLFFPITIASMILGVTDFLNDPNLNTLILPYTIGMVAAGIVTYFSFKWLSSIVKKGKLWKFAIYCIIAGIFVLYYFR